MKNLEVISLVVTSIIALWNIYLQIQIKRIETKNILLNKFVEQEYDCYKNLWELLSKVKTETAQLRKPNKKNQIEKTENQMEEYSILLKGFEERIISSAPFLPTEIVAPLQKVVRISKLEYLQTSANPNNIGSKELSDSLNNNTNLEKTILEAESVLRDILRKN